MADTLKEALEKLEDWLSPDVPATIPIEFSVNALNSMKRQVQRLRAALSAPQGQSQEASDGSRQKTNADSSIHRDSVAPVDSPTAVSPPQVTPPGVESGSGQYPTCPHGRTANMGCTECGPTQGNSLATAEGYECAARKALQQIIDSDSDIDDAEKCRYCHVVAGHWDHCPSAIASKALSRPCPAPVTREGLRQKAYDTWSDMLHLSDDAQIDVLLRALQSVAGSEDTALDGERLLARLKDSFSEGELSIVRAAIAEEKTR